MSNSWIYDLFVSYASEDRAWVEQRLLPALAAAGVRSTAEPAYAAGTPRRAEFEPAFHASQWLLIVLSPDYLAGDYTAFLQVVAETCGPPETWPAISLIVRPVLLPPQLGPLMTLDASSPAREAAALARLSATVGRPPPAPAPAPPDPAVVAASPPTLPAEAYVYCSHCGTRNLRSSRYCDQCSAPLLKHGETPATTESEDFVTTSVPGNNVTLSAPPTTASAPLETAPSAPAAGQPPPATSAPTPPLPAGAAAPTVAVAPDSVPVLGGTAPPVSPPVGAGPAGRPASRQRGWLPMAVSAAAVVALVLALGLVLLPQFAGTLSATPTPPPAPPSATAPAPPTGTLPPTAAPTTAPPVGVGDTPTTQARTPSPATALSATVAATVAAAASPTGGPLPPPVGQLIWQEDFKLDAKPAGASPTPSAADLYAVANQSGLPGADMSEPGFSLGMHLPGVYHVQIKNLNDTRWMTLTRFAAADFSLQVDVWDNSDTHVGTLGQGIIFRERDADHFYALLVNPRGRQYTVRKLDGATQWSDLIPWTTSALVKSRDEHNQIRLDAVGDKFTFYLNGTFLASASDGSYKFGMPGLIVANGDAANTHTHFDDVRIWDADPPPPAPRIDAAKKMVLIPAGEFVLGWYDKADERANIVNLPDFYIDQTEVTNQDYRRCVDAKKCTPPAVGDSSTHRDYFTQTEFDSFPVINVSWSQARAFCQWAGKRLPSEAEWEKAASWDGAHARKAIWPWADNTFDLARLNSRDSEAVDTTAVGSFPAELNGTFDMAGNVREWTSSLFTPYPYRADDGREDPQASGQRVYRGGSWEQSWGKAKTFVREGADPDYYAQELGFRCAAMP